VLELMEKALKEGYGKKTIAHNFHVLKHNSDRIKKIARLHGKAVAHKVMIAAVLNNARKSKSKRGKTMAKSLNAAPLVMYVTSSPTEA
jgi:adenylylsulfate kinase-like enzyme